jgi:hypothetical protein
MLRLGFEVLQYNEKLTLMPYVLTMSDEKQRRPLFSKTGLSVIFLGLGIMIGFIIGINAGGKYHLCLEKNFQETDYCRIIKWYIL